jgi:hypothetical protein
MEVHHPGSMDPWKLIPGAMKVFLEFQGSSCRHGVSSWSSRYILEPWELIFVPQRLIMETCGRRGIILEMLGHVLEPRANPWVMELTLGQWRPLLMNCWILKPCGD